MLRVFELVSKKRYGVVTKARYGVVRKIDVASTAFKLKRYFIFSLLKCLDINKGYRRYVRTVFTNIGATFYIVKLFKDLLASN